MRTTPAAPARAAGASDNSSPADTGESFTPEGGTEARRSEVPECSADPGRTTCVPTNMPPCLSKINFSRRMKTLVLYTS